VDHNRTVWIDRTASTTEVELEAIRHWPHDPVARKNYLTTYAQVRIEETSREAAQAGAAILRRKLAQALPEGTSECDANPFAASVHAEVARGVEWAQANARAGIEHDLLEPHGGYARLREAPGVKALRAAKQANRKLGAACGEILVYILIMKTHHRDEFEASINRARKIMEKTAQEEGRAHTLPPKRLRTTMWKTWQAVAPLWAAEALCRHAASKRGERWVLRESLPELIAVSHWLINFGLNVVPKGSHEGPLLREDRLVIIDCDGVSAREPEIPRLTEQQLKWAHG
jgi:hypothetical protein